MKYDKKTLGGNLDTAARAELIISQYPSDRRYALAALQSMQREFNYIPKEGLLALAHHVGCRSAELYAMATFYKALSLEPKGRHIIKVCDGTACHIYGATSLVIGLERLLSIKPGQTTQDGEFSIELVNCVGSCALAPVVVIDEEYHGKVSMESLPALIDAYSRKGECDE